MGNTLKSVCVCIMIVLSCTLAGAQSTNSTLSPVVPQLVNFSGRAVNDQGKPITGIVGISFSIYNAQAGGSPLWIETQNVQPDTTGNYTVQLGATTSEGLPLDLFASGEARWLGVRVNSSEEQPRILLLSVPYALKAADAQTLGGLPASAFALAGSSGSAAPAAPESSSSASASLAPTVGGGGLENYIPVWADNNDDLGNSVLYQSGSGSSAKIGINITKPLFTLDVNGQELVRGLFEMATQNYASKTKGYDSQPLNLESSAFDSTTGTYTLNHFQWQAEPVGNNTPTPAATLNLLYGTDPANPAETGLMLNSSGIFTFATGQTFPGTGTITGVTTASGSGLSGGGTSGNLNLSLVNTCSTSQVLQWNGSAWACSPAGTGTITGVTAGTDLTGGGSSGNVTLNLDTTQVPQLVASNTFTGNQTVNGNLLAYTQGTGSAGVGGSNINGTGVGGDGLTGVYGSGTNYGVYGSAEFGYDPGDGVYGVGPGAGVYGQGLGSSSIGVFGFGTTGVTAVGSNTSGGPFTGVYATATGWAVSANGTEGGTGILAGSDTGFAGYFSGNVEVEGGFSVSGHKQFKIDHPVDPANKYLVHSSVESSEMMNIYTGNVTSDARGEATVRLPEWFEALNTDFRYQLTVVGQFAQAIVSHEIEHQQFQIKTNIPNVKVSWLVTGVRQDAYAKAYPMQVEVDKPEQERGFYLHPALYGAPEQKGILWAIAPKAMEQWKRSRTNPPVIPAPPAAPAVNLPPFPQHQAPARIPPGKQPPPPQLGVPPHGSMK
jgi:hypothetical protein